jgi:hypothetical protein
MSDEQHELVVAAVGDALATLSIPSTGNAGVARPHRA